MADFDAKVTGADEVAEAARRFAAGLDGHLRTQFQDRARMIARDAQGAVPRRTGAARASVDVQTIEGAVAIVAGGRRAPYFPWLEFGGRVGRNDSVNRPFVRDGRYLGRAIDAQLSDIEAAAARAVVDAGRDAGFEVTGGA